MWQVWHKHNFLFSFIFNFVNRIVGILAEKSLFLPQFCRRGDVLARRRNEMWCCFLTCRGNQGKGNLDHLLWLKIIISRFNSSYDKSDFSLQSKIKLIPHRKVEVLRKQEFGSFVTMIIVKHIPSVRRFFPQPPTSGDLFCYLLVFKHRNKANELEDRICHVVVTADSDFYLFWSWIAAY